MKKAILFTLLVLLLLEAAKELLFWQHNTFEKIGNLR